MRKGGRYQAQISYNKRKFVIGLFDTPEDASAAYQSAKSVLHAGAVLVDIKTLTKRSE